MEQFSSLYRLYMEKEGLLDAPCLTEALLRLQEAACYDWESCVLQGFYVWDK